MKPVQGQDYILQLGAEVRLSVDLPGSIALFQSCLSSHWLIHGLSEAGGRGRAFINQTP